MRGRRKKGEKIVEENEEMKEEETRGKDEG